MESGVSCAVDNDSRTSDIVNDENNLNMAQPPSHQKAASTIRNHNHNNNSPAVRMQSSKLTAASMLACALCLMVLVVLVINQGENNSMLNRLRSRQQQQQEPQRRHNTETTTTTTTANQRKLGQDPVKGSGACNYVPGTSPPGIRDPCDPDAQDDEFLDEAPVDVAGSNGTDTEFAPQMPPGRFPPPSGDEDDVPLNVVGLKVYVALGAGVPSVKHHVRNLITTGMNETIDNMNFFFGRPPLPEAVAGEINDANDTTPVEELFEPPAENTGEEEEGTFVSFPINQPEDETSTGVDNGARRRFLQEGPMTPVELPPPPPVDGPTRPPNNNRPPRPAPIQVGGGGAGKKEHTNRFNMFYVDTHWDIYERDNTTMWWWEYELLYFCFWEDDSTKVGKKVMDKVLRNMTVQVFDEKDLLRDRLRNMSGHHDLLLELFPYPIIPPPETDAPTEAKSPFENLDAHEWSWTRYLGFIVFLATFSSLIVTSQIGAVRRKQRVRQQVWGNLASEEGVKELLNTGWILRDDRMEVYDKERVGYRDDDSMLIGGFEQREPGPGTEIVTPTTAEETSTRGGSTTPRDVSTQRS